MHCPNNLPLSHQEVRRNLAALNRSGYYPGVMAPAARGVTNFFLIIALAKLAS